MQSILLGLAALLASPTSAALRYGSETETKFKYYDYGTHLTTSICKSHTTIANAFRYIRTGYDDFWEKRHTSFSLECISPHACDTFCQTCCVRMHMIFLYVWYLACVCACLLRYARIVSLSRLSYSNGISILIHTHFSFPAILKRELEVHC